MSRSTAATRVRKVDEWWGEPGRCSRPNGSMPEHFNILAYWCGTPGRPVNAIPPKAVANCQLRFVAGTKVENVVPALERHLKAQRPRPGQGDAAAAGQRRRVSRDAHRARPSLGGVRASLRCSVRRTANRRSFRRWAARSATTSSPTTSALPTIWIPHSYASCSQHWPDEHILLGLSRNALELMAGLYWDIGSGERVPPKSA